MAKRDCGVMTKRDRGMMTKRDCGVMTKRDSGVMTDRYYSPATVFRFYAWSCIRICLVCL